MVRINYNLLQGTKPRIKDNGKFIKKKTDIRQNESAGQLEKR